MGIQMPMHQRTTALWPTTTINDTTTHCLLKGELVNQVFLMLLLLSRTSIYHLSKYSAHLTYLGRGGKKKGERRKNSKPSRRWPRSNQPHTYNVKSTRYFVHHGKKMGNCVSTISHHIQLLRLNALDHRSPCRQHILYRLFSSSRHPVPSAAFLLKIFLGGSAGFALLGLVQDLPQKEGHLLDVWHCSVVAGAAS